MVLNEYTAIMWSMEGDHSTAVRPNKSPLKRGFQRCFLTHSLPTKPKNSGSGTVWSQNPGKGQTHPGNQKKMTVF